MTMRIGGFQKLSLVDYPGKTAAILFTIGCNFRCPFCHNPELQAKSEEIPQEHIFSYLEKNKNLLGGVVITGGEPTIHKDLPDFLGRMKGMGFSVKLDTNGTNPVMLRRLLDEKLIDYVAMDVKAPFLKGKYKALTGNACSEEMLQAVRDSAAILIESGIEHEFRTTVIRECHAEKDVKAMSKSIAGAKKYYLQSFRPEKTLDPAYGKKTAYNDDQMLAMLADLHGIAEVGVR